MTTGEAVKWLVRQHGSLEKGWCNDCNAVDFITKRLEAFEEMRETCRLTLEWLDLAMSRKQNVDGLLDAMPNNFGGRKALRAALKLAEEAKP